jgi:TolB protein
LLRPIPPTPTDTPSPAPTNVGGRSRLIAFTSTRDGNSEIYMMNADGSDQRNLTQHPAWDSDPAWSPDGQRLAFVSDRAGGMQVFVLELATRAVTQVTDFPSLMVNEFNWLPDNQSLIIARPRAVPAAGARFGLYRVNADGSGGDWLLPDAEAYSDGTPPIQLTFTGDDYYPRSQPAP